LRSAIARNAPLQLAGAVTAYTAKLAERAGFEAIYVSGGGVAVSSCGVPDLGITTLADVVTDVRRIAAAIESPIVVDIDTGWGTAFNIARAIREIENAGAAAVHIEDQVAAKRCGHRPGKQIVSAGEMVDRVRAAVDARRDADFMIIARTDAVAAEGIDAALARAQAYVAAGADAVFPEALATLADYRRFVDTIDVPVLANITEFGQTPLFTRAELASAGVQIILYPLSAFRAMSLAAIQVYETILRDGTQYAVLPMMQTRAELYEAIGYHAYEEKLDALFARDWSSVEVNS
jgi:methylisocitrate lyase